MVVPHCGEWVSLLPGNLSISLSGVLDMEHLLKEWNIIHGSIVLLM